MGVFAGPDISESGLVLALDAGNLKSYDFTENLTPYSAARISPNNWTEATSDTTYQQLDLNALGRFPGVLVTSTTGQAWHRRGTGYTQSFVSGTTYTLTYFYRAGSTGNARLQVRINSVESLLQGPVNGSNWTVQQTAGTITNISTTLLEDGLTYKTSYTLTSNQTGNVSIAIGIGSAVVNGTIIALGVQLEQRDFATDYYETTGTPKTKSTSFIDISNNSNTGTLTNGPTYSSDTGGNLGFDGVDDYVGCGNDASINFGTGDFTVSVWFRRFSNATGNLRLLSKAAGGDSANAASAGFCFFGSDTGISFAVNPTAARTIIGAASYSVNEWVNVVGLVERGVSMRTYKNASLVASTTAPSGSVSGTTSLFIGNNTGVNLFWAGEIAQVQLYNKALTASEIQQNFIATRGRFGI